MQIIYQINKTQHVLEIKCLGQISGEGAHKIIQRAMVKAYGHDFQEALLDLRGVICKDAKTVFRLHSMVQACKSILMHLDVRVTIMFNLEDGARWMFLEKAEEFDGINMRYFNNRKAALLGARLFSVPPKANSAKRANVWPEQISLL